MDNSEMNMNELLEPNLERDLLHAVEEGIFDEVEEIFRHLELNVSEEAFGYLLLVTALQQGHEHIAKLLIMKNCRVRISTQTSTHSTPLYYAVNMNNLKIFEALYKRGASIYDKDANQISALELALVSEKLDFVNHVLRDIKLSQRSNLLEPSCENDVALFHAACLANNVRSMKLFINQGFSVNTCSLFCNEEWKGFTPLHFALERPTRCSALLSLLKHNVNFHAKDLCGNTPLHLAFRRDSARRSYSFALEVVKKYVSRVNGENFQNAIDLTGLSHFHILCSINFKDDCGGRSNFVIDEDAIRNRLNLLKYLIDNGKIDINDCALPGANYYTGFTALHFAARNTCYDALKLLLENGADFTKVDHTGNTPLHVVSQNYSIPMSQDTSDIINLLLKHGVDIDAKNLENATALHYAFHGQHRHNYRSIQYLLSKSKSSLNHIDQYGLSNFHIACTGVDLSLVERLLMNGASIDACIKTELKDFDLVSQFRLKYPSRGCSALHFAIKFNRAEIVEYLLGHGADIHNSSNKYNTTPLHLACAHELSRFSESENESDVKETDWVLSRTNHIRIVELLLEYGASVNAKNSSGNTPLFDTCTNYRYPFSTHEQLKLVIDEISLRQQKIIEILLRHGADINDCTGNQERLLHVVTRCSRNGFPSQIDFIETLLKNGADVRVVDGEGRTPLHYIVELPCNPSLVDLYLQYGADINATAQRVGTPLHCTLKRVEHDHSSTRTVIFAKLMSQPDIDLNTQDNSGDTPLHVAMRERQDSHIQDLLNAGADLNIENAIGFPPIHYLSPRNVRNDVFLHGCLKTCITLVVNHIKKLTRLNFPVNEKVRSYSEELQEYRELPNLIADATIDAEVEQLMSSKVDQFTTLYDILRKKASDLRRHVRNANFRKLISSAQLTIDYPLFYNMLINQYKRGVARGSLMDRAEEALSLVTHISWPDSCAEHILKYLDNRHLRILIESTFKEKLNQISVPDLPMSKEHATKFA